MRRNCFVGLIAIDFPGHALRLCEGGFVDWNGEIYRADDPVFGTLGEIEDLSEGVGEEVPVFNMTLLPPGTTTPAQLSQPGYQSSTARFWIGEYDPDTGRLSGAPDLQFEGEVDQTNLVFGADSRVLEMTIVSGAARLLERNIGNSLNPAWHKSIWPGETGHDNATGTDRPIAWGVEAPASGGFYHGGGGGGWRGGGPGYRARQVLQ